MKRKNSCASRSSKRLTRLSPNIQACLNISVPHSLVAVAPFFDEALHVLRQEGTSTKQSMVIALSCIDHALELVDKYDLRMDEAGIESIIAFKQLVILLDEELVQLESGSGDISSSDSHVSSRKSESHHGVARQPVPRRRGMRTPESIHREMVISQANASYELAEEMYSSKLVDEAARLFHTAAVYYRMAHPLDEELLARLEKATSRSRESARFAENIVLEHFSGSDFAGTYIDVMESLGKGNFGSVHICIHRQTKDRLARKEIKLREISPYHLHLLHSEIKIMKALDHPNIVKLKEVFFEPKKVYLIMDMCTGGDLYEYLKTHGPQPETTVARMLRDMASAVRYLHEQGVVHRDIKLQNFMFESKTQTQEQASQLKLIDFGLSKHFDVDETMSRLVGTPYYIAPEVWNGQYNERCDTWSLGVCAYVLILGVLPFEGRDMDDVRRRITELEPSYRTNELAASPEAVDLLRRFFVKSPAHRIDLGDCFEHPFMLKATASSTAADGTLNPSNHLIRYLNMTETKRLLLRAVASTLSSQHIAKLSRGFIEMDKDKNGVISLQELRVAFESSVLQGQEFSLSRDDIESMFSDLEVDSDVQINYSEFLAAAMSKQLCVEEERLQVAFRSLDLEGRGYLTRDSIRLALGQDKKDAGSLLDALVNMNVSSAEDDSVERKIDSVFDELDFNKDGKIEFYEFLKYWRNFNCDKHASIRSKFSKAIKSVLSGFGVISKMSKKSS